MGPALKTGGGEGGGGPPSVDSTQHLVINSAPTCWKGQAIGICRNHPRGRRGGPGQVVP